MRYLIFDTETSGLDPNKYELLTSHFIVADAELNTIDSLSLKTKPDNRLIKSDPKAMQINKINLKKHEEEAITYKEASLELFRFLTKNLVPNTKFIAIGHNINFDLSFINSHLIKKEQWNSLVDYNVLDTKILASFFGITGMIPKSDTKSLSKLAAHLDVGFSGDPHTAKADAIVTMNIYKIFYNHFKQENL